MSKWANEQIRFSRLVSSDLGLVGCSTVFWEGGTSGKRSSEKLIRLVGKAATDAFEKGGQSKLSSHLSSRVKLKVGAREPEEFGW